MAFLCHPHVSDAQDLSCHGLLEGSMTRSNVSRLNPGEGSQSGAMALCLAMVVSDSHVK